MINTTKKKLYFFVAAYFGFLARIVLLRWQPRVVVITGSTGKTTLLHMAEAQLGDKAIYTHKANSTFGIPFFILGFKAGAENRLSWPIYILKAPFCIFRSLPPQKILVAEVDAERPGEARFLAKLLKPEVTLWITVFRTHSMSFDKLVQTEKFTSHKEAIAYEFGYIPANTSKLVIANDDQPDMIDQLSRVPKSAKIIKHSLSSLKDFSISDGKTTFKFGKKSVSLPGLHPKELGLSLQMIDELTAYFDIQTDNSYANLKLPPGRSSVFKGKNNLTIVDSTYNSAFGALRAIVELFNQLPGEHKWLIIGDMLEQGDIEEQEHLKLGEYIAKQKADKFILIGPRVKKYALPILQKTHAENVVAFDGPKEVLDYIEQNIKGGETLLFKGSRFLEGVIEQLLEDPADAKNLARRSKLWIKRRQSWGLPK